MQRVRIWLRDWWRWYTDADWEYAMWLYFHIQRGLGLPGEVHYMSQGQYRAYLAFQRAWWA